MDRTDVPAIDFRRATFARASRDLVAGYRNPHIACDLLHRMAFQLPPLDH